MHAFLTVLPAEGAGDPVSGDQVWKLLKDRGVISGIREDVIEAAVKQVNNGEGIENLLVAQGEEPSHGSTNRMDMLVEMASGKNVTIRNDGSADYKNLQKITMVSKGQKIARLMPPEEKGEDGRDIFGKVIPAKKYQGFDLDIGAHIARQEEEDGSVLLIAETDGRLEYDKKSIYIERAFQVAGDVDIKTGNIKFKGAVQIKGSVQTGFSVISTDSIQIGESVEGALVSADGDIVVNQGIKGGGKAVLRTKESVKALFAEQSRILAVKDVIFKNFCLRSIVKCNGKMVLMSDKGHFIGGSARARYGMEVMNLGSEKEVKTEVCFGQDYLIADQIEIEEREINKIKEKLLSFDVFMLKMEKQGERERLERARKEKLKLMKFLEKHSLRLFTLREKFEEHYPSEIVVKGYLYPGVVIESHGRIFSPKTAKKGVKIVFNQESGQLEEQSLSEK